MNDGYFMRNATYAMMEAAPDLPAFSITLRASAIGLWAEWCLITALWARGWRSKPSVC